MYQPYAQQQVPQQQVPQQQVPQQQPTTQPANGIATASMILGILSVVFCWWGIGTLVLAVLAVTFGAVALRRAQAGAANKGFAITGLSTGLVGLVLYLIIGIATRGVFLLI